MWQLTVFVMTLNEFVMIKTFTVQKAVQDYLNYVKRESRDILETDIAQKMDNLYTNEIAKKKYKYNINIQINNNLDVAVQLYQKKDYKGKSS